MTANVCSGHGQSYDLGGRSLCVCDAAWLGSSDMFDQVVAHRESDNAPLLLDCLVPTTGVQVVVSPWLGKKCPCTRASAHAFLCMQVGD